MADALVTKYPWELPAVPTTEETVRLLQQDFAYAVTHTAILVHSTRAELRMVVNTPRGQLVPRGISKFTDGTTVELQDLGMPQPNVQTMTVNELVACVVNTAHELGLEMVT